MKLLKTVCVILALAAFALLVGCHGSTIPTDNGAGDGGDGSGGELDVPAYAGDWEGGGNNTTFGSSGDASASISVNQTDQTVQVTVDFDGSVFGGADPDPFVINGTYDDNSLSIEGQQTDLGAIDIDIDDAGNLSGTVSAVPAPNIDTVNFSGTIGSDRIQLNYIVHFSDGDSATGSLQLDKVS